VYGPQAASNKQNRYLPVRLASSISYKVVGNKYEVNIRNELDSTWIRTKEEIPQKTWYSTSVYNVTEPVTVA
jgi:hypothetical protein